MRQSSSPGFPYLLLSTWVPLPIKSLALSACVSSDNSFPSDRQEPSFRPWKGSPFLQQLLGHSLRLDYYCSVLKEWLPSLSIEWQQQCIYGFCFCWETNKVSNEVTQSCPTLCDPMDCSLPGSSVHEIFQAIVLEWIAISFSSGSSLPRDWTQVSRIVDRCFAIWATREVLTR